MTGFCIGFGALSLGKLKKVGFYPRADIFASNLINAIRWRWPGRGQAVGGLGVLGGRVLRSQWGDGTA